MLSNKNSLIKRKGKERKGKERKGKSMTIGSSKLTLFINKIILILYNIDKAISINFDSMSSYYYYNIKHII